MSKRMNNGATLAVGLVAIAAALIAGRVIVLKFFPGSLLPGWIIPFGN